MLTSQKIFRVEKFQFFEIFINVVNNVPVSIFDLWALPRDVSNEKPSKIIVFSSPEFRAPRSGGPVPAARAGGHNERSRERPIMILCSEKV